MGYCAEAIRNQCQQTCADWGGRALCENDWSFIDL